MTTNDVRLQNALSKLLISRPDVIAIQRDTGAYNPLDNSTWNRRAMSEHLAGENTYGHYVINGDKAKFFCFDIDFKTKCPYYSPENPLHNPRKLWMDTNGNDPYLRWQVRVMADLFCHRIGITGVRQLATFSGSKGLHVYGFPYPGQQAPASVLRAMGRQVMDRMGYFFTDRSGSGVNFDGNPNDPTVGLFQVELFPKQDSVPDGGYGNLVRMELGINRKSMQPGFVIDTLADSYYLEPVKNPVEVFEKILGAQS
ncbi:hypothetical protein GMA3_103 [Gordonia phage GMA3]|uniref:DNA primase n=1 Tax=Gordonia phage GMA3 TaxID=1647284 RepID=A0A0K0NKP2_9CAUD|nr:DNA primase [Gordonia phage GMA3]AKL88280.1 hypothetical protein GMA3_103 [Gordonia phage GMA3]